MKRSVRWVLNDLNAMTAVTCSVQTVARKVREQGRYQDLAEAVERAMYDIAIVVRLILRPERHSLP